jgi:ABC-type polysaccharide/polyol phosphate export permease
MKRISKFFNSAYEFFALIIRQRELLLSLSHRDFENKYIKNVLGMVWAILDPLAFVTILYFVFGARFGDRMEMGVPYIAYLLCGYIAFGLFSDSLNNLTTVVKDHSFLLKKVNFSIAILPIMRLLTNLFVHFIVLAICMGVLLIINVSISVFWFQILYYILALSFFLIAAAWFTSSVYLFFPDIRNIISIITRVLFFTTPIFWTTEAFPSNVLFVLKLNPLFYIVNGYRNSLLYRQGFWESPWLTAYFWAFSFLVLLLGVVVFKKLRPHFADVV